MLEGGHQIFRDARREDRATLEEIIQKSFRHGIYTFFARRSLKSAPKVIVSEMHGKVAGFAEPKVVRIGARTIGNILWIAVHPDYRRRGVATALVDECVRYLSENRAGDVFISVEPNNLPAFELFESRGFRKVRPDEIGKTFGLRRMSFYSKLLIAPHEVVLVRSSNALKGPFST